jgi:hypothetical protein
MAARYVYVEIGRDVNMQMMADVTEMLRKAAPLEFGEPGASATGVLRSSSTLPARQSESDSYFA